MVHRRGGTVVREESFIGGRSIPPRPPVAPGLGDLVEHFAKPVAHLIDAATERFLPADWQTRLAGCAACSRRRHKLNLLCPDIERCPVLEQILGVLPEALRAHLIEAIRRRPG